MVDGYRCSHELTPMSQLSDEDPIGVTPKLSFKGACFSAGNSTQYSVMAYMGKNLKKKRVDICICITDSLCCTPETNTTL